MIYLTFRSGERAEDAKVLAATSDPCVVKAAIQALVARLSTPLHQGEGDSDETVVPQDRPGQEQKKEVV